MPIEYKIDHAKRLIVARGSGVFTDSDVFDYQREAWSSPEVAGYDELVDMTDVQEVALPSADSMRALASISASIDPPEGGTKLAIVAPQDFAFGLGRMYEAYRGFQRASKKEVAVFRTLPEALAFLGKEGAETR